VVDDAALAALAARAGIQELTLFGSVLRDDFTPASDVDVLVTFLPDSPVRGLLDFTGVKQDLQPLFHRSVDVIEPHTLHPFMASCFTFFSVGLRRFAPLRVRCFRRLDEC
jgi:predicted nucleotidyltransferase